MRAHSSPLGLRAQIVLALCLVFLSSFWLLGFATLQITRRNALAEHSRSERLLEAALAPEWSRFAPSDKVGLEAACASLRARLPHVRARLTWPNGARFECGEPFSLARAPSSTAAVQLRLRLPDSSEQNTRAVGRLLLFYLALTGACVVLFAYVLLTRVIVRPLERLTRSAEQFAHGQLNTEVAEYGSAETARLSRTFKRMAELLQAERTALTERLAELERTTRDLRHTQRQLIHGEKLASVGRLAAGVAHEIGNPLTAILGLIELLQSGDLSPEQSREFLARIAGETDRIHGIIRNLLDFARVDSGHAAARDPVESCALEEAIADAVNLVRPQKSARAVHIQVSIEAGLEPVLGARARLTQVLLNLLLNAVDAIAGTGRVEIRAEHEPATNSVRLCVQDDGPGIAPEIAQTLFEPFSTTKSPGKGTGLGLAVTHAIVEGLGGSITAGNRAGGGACFELHLPCAKPAPGRPAMSQAV